MPLLAKRTVKYGGRYYKPGEELPASMPREIRADLKKRGAAVEGLTDAQAKRAQKIAEKIDAIKAEIVAGNARLVELQAESDALLPIADDLANRKRALKEVGDDGDKAAAQAAVEEAEAARKRAAALVKEREDLESAIEAKTAALAELE